MSKITHLDPERWAKEAIAHMKESAKQPTVRDFIVAVNSKELCEELENLIKANLILIPHSRVRHIKTNGVYTVLAVGFRESNLQPEVSYRCIQTGLVFFRPVSEFIDGRFES